MKQVLKLYLLAILIISLSSFKTEEIHYFVSPSGNDVYEGTKAAPFATLERALQQIQEDRQKGNHSMVKVFLRGGTYYFQSTVKINGTLSNIHIQPYQSEQVIFSGGIAIPSPFIKKSTKSTFKNHYSVNLKHVGITNYGTLRHVGFARPYGPAWGEPFVNKKPLHLSRWPNQGMVPMGKVLDKGSVPRNDDFSNRGGLIKYNDARIDKWANETDVWMSGYFMWGYADDMVKIASVDTKAQTLKTASATLYGYGDSKPWRQWYGVNILAELDAPGEYYIDRKEGILQFILEDDEIESLEFSILEAPFFTIQNTTHILIEGIQFECSRGLGIAMDNTHNATIKDCAFRNLGSIGILVGKGVEPFDKYRHEGTEKVKSGIVGSLQQHLYANSTFYSEGGKNNKIIGCEFYNLGAGGVILGGGNLKTLEKGNNSIENCVFHDLNRIEKSYRPAVHLTGVGNTVRHCEIYNTPSMAIYLMFGNDNIIEYNYIHDVCLEVEDQGAIYYGRNPAERGNIVRYNYFENIPDHYNTCAVYHDDGACGMTVLGNVFYKAGKWNALIGGGSDNVYRNNIFISNKIGIHVDNRLQNWSKALLDKNGLFEQRLKAVNFTAPPYSNSYPEIVTYFENPEHPKRNVVENNVFVNVEQLLDGKKEWLDYKDNNWETDHNIAFADWDIQNFNLDSNSEVYKKLPDFKEIPFHKIGLYETKSIKSIRKRNGLRVSVNENNIHEWQKIQEKELAYQVKDPIINNILKTISEDSKAVIFPNPNPGAQWFGEGHFGLFMHWGPHSTQGSQPSWAMIKNYPHGYEEKYANPEDYFALAENFHPTDWDPDKICKAAKEAGITYVVLGAKHHDGFALWPSTYGNYNISTYVPDTDLLKPYVEACRKYGLKVGFYFSQRDWHFPNYPLGDQNFNFRTRNKFPLVDPEIDSMRYKNWWAYTIGQLKELLTNYGQIDVLWFDGFYWPGKEKEAYTDGLFNWIRTLQPGIVVNDRWYKMRSPDAKEEEIGKGDFATVEWKEPEEGINKWWEFTTSWCGSWGYSSLRFSAKEALDKLILARSLGGNFLINIGPSGNGVPPKDFYKNMAQLAEWIVPNKEALFGKELLPAPKEWANAPITKHRNALYLHVLPNRLDDKVSLFYNGKIGRVTNLSSGKKINIKKEKNGYSFSLKKSKLDFDTYQVIKVEIKKL
ncbi:alpha-L-fucosidase [Aestuariivivens sp. NBU2969]|uniref:alpha-L-fucosidase n=1 Tax=Aestuariivivens sp. NBU2969 TaxID=2873267 RepID=UPI001CC069C6|nr:alpha-L-fucosidase [Aestuariivivens sp. NBU2969]